MYMEKTPQTSNEVLLRLKLLDCSSVRYLHRASQYLRQPLADYSSNAEISSDSTKTVIDNNTTTIFVSPISILQIPQSQEYRCFPAYYPHPPTFLFTSTAAKSTSSHTSSNQPYQPKRYIHDRAHKSDFIRSHPRSVWHTHLRTCACAFCRTIDKGHSCPPRLPHPYNV